MTFQLTLLCGVFLLPSFRFVTSLQLDAKGKTTSLESARVVALESYMLLRKLDEGESLPFANLSKAVSGVTDYVAAMATSNGLPATVKPFIILSQQRSGSGFFCAMLDSHPDLMCALGEPFGPGTYYGTEQFHGSLNQGFDRAIKKVLENLTTDNLPSNVKWFGIKVQSNQVAGIEGGVADTDAMVIFHYRRNALRQIISGTASRDMKDELNPHAMNEEEAIAKAEDKPTIGPNIQSMILARIMERNSIIGLMTKARANVCMTSHYEDWLNPVTAPVVKQKIFDCFGVEPAELSALTVAVHANIPLLETVSNPDEVVRALTGGPFEYMLESNATFEEVFENLKLTDAYELTPPEL